MSKLAERIHEACQNGASVSDVIEMLSPLSEAQAEIEKYKSLYEGLKAEVPNIIKEAVDTGLKGIEEELFETVVMPSVRSITAVLKAENSRLRESLENLLVYTEHIKRRTGVQMNDPNTGACLAAREALGK